MPVRHKPKPGQPRWKGRTGPKKPDRANAKERILEVLSKGGTLTRAALACGLTRRHIRDMRLRDAEFDEKCDEAVESGTDVLEDEAYRRAANGTLKPIYQGGKMVGQVREYSDTLTIFLLKGRRPEKFKDRAELTGPNGAQLAPVLNIHLAANAQVKAAITGNGHDRTGDQSLLTLQADARLPKPRD